MLPWGRLPPRSFVQAPLKFATRGLGSSPALKQSEPPIFAALKQCSTHSSKGFAVLQQHCFPVNIAKGQG